MEKTPKRWIYQVTDSDIKEIDQCLDEIRKSSPEVEKQSMQKISRKDIDLGNFGERIEAIRKDLSDGIGFHLIRGIPLDKYSRFEICLIYWCVGLYLGQAVSQNHLV